MRRSRSNGPLPVSVEAALADLGIEIDAIRKDEAWALCPAHLAFTGRVDRKASWSVNLNSGRHKCFSCGFGGPFIVLVKWMQNTHDEHAREWIRKHGGFNHVLNRLRGETGFVEPVPEPVSEANLALFRKPPKRALKEKDVTRESCKAYGVLWDHEKNSWVFPVRDPYTDELRGWQEKNSRFFHNVPKHMVKRDCLFGTHLFDGGRAVVVESPLDAVHLLSLGITGGLGSMGVDLSEEQIGYLIENADEVIWALDNDKAGIRKSDEIRKRYTGRVPMRFYHYGDSEHKDPGTQNRDEIRWGIDNATTAVLTRF